VCSNQAISTWPVRCAFSDIILRSRMPLDPTPARLKLLHACDQWHSSRESTLSYRCRHKSCRNTEGQIWQTRDTVCGEWWNSRCSRRFYEHPPLALSHARIEGAEATLRLYVFFQEDGAGSGSGPNNNGMVSQSAFNRKLIVNGTRCNDRCYVYYEVDGLCFGWVEDAIGFRSLRHLA
jgi:hypothetical protein